MFGSNANSIPQWARGRRDGSFEVVVMRQSVVLFRLVSIFCSYDASRGGYGKALFQLVPVCELGDVQASVSIWDNQICTAIIVVFFSFERTYWKRECNLEYRKWVPGVYYLCGFSNHGGIWLVRPYDTTLHPGCPQLWDEHEDFRLLEVPILPVFSYYSHLVFSKRLGQRLVRSIAVIDFIVMTVLTTRWDLFSCFLKRSSFDPVCSVFTAARSAEVDWSGLALLDTWFTYRLETGEVFEFTEGNTAVWGRRPLDGGVPLISRNTAGWCHSFRCWPASLHGRGSCEDLPFW